MNVLQELDSILMKCGITDANYEIAKFNSSSICLRTIPSQGTIHKDLSGLEIKSSRVELVVKDKDLQKAYNMSLGIINILNQIDRFTTQFTENFSVKNISNTPVDMVTENGDVIYVTEFDVEYMDK